MWQKLNNQKTFFRTFTLLGWIFFPPSKEKKKERCRQVSFDLFRFDILEFLVEDIWNIEVVLLLWVCNSGIGGSLAEHREFCLC